MSDDPNNPTAPATQQPQQPQQPSPVFTQDQVNHFNAEAKRTAVSGFLKEAGLENLSAEQLKDLATKAQAHDQANATVETERDQFKAEAQQVPTLKAQIRRAELAAEGDRPLPPHLWKYVEGNNDDEINASITKIKTDFGLIRPDGSPPPQQVPGIQPNPAAGFHTGYGTQPVPKTMQSGADAYAARHGQKK